MTVKKLRVYGGRVGKLTPNWSYGEEIVIVIIVYILLYI